MFGAAKKEEEDKIVSLARPEELSWMRLLEKMLLQKFIWWGLSIRIRGRIVSQKTCTPVISSDPLFT
mgnify:CR=1 FL=1